MTTIAEKITQTILSELDDVDPRSPNAEGNYVSRCPFHPTHDGRPFSFHPERGYICFSCGAKGSVSALAKHVGLDLPDSGNGTYQRLNVNEARAKLHQRGIRDETIELFQITEDERTQSWAFPIVLDGQAVATRHKAFQKREKGPKYWWKPRRPRSLLYNFDAVRHHPEVWCLEGEPDVWIAAQAGVPAFCLASGAENPPSDIDCQMIKDAGFDTVHIIYDLDDAGKEGARTTAETLQRYDVNTVVHDLPANLGSKADVNNWYLMLGCDDAALQDALIRLPEAESPLPFEIIQPPQLVSPGLDYDGKTVYVTQQLAIRADDGNGDKVDLSVPVIITSERRVYRPPEPKNANEIMYLPNGAAIDKPLERANSRWSVESLREFLQNRAEAEEPYSLFSDIRREFSARIWWPDQGEYDLVSLYVMLSYIFHLYDSLPYLHFNGVAGAGKTTTAAIMAQVGHNGVMVVDPTESSLFRTIERERPLLILDEQENIASRKSSGDNPAVTLLKAGYKKGTTVPRNEKIGNRWVTVHYAVYSPKVIANVFGLEDILADRCIPITMKRMPPDEAPNYRSGPILPATARALVDRLYTFTMQHTGSIAAYLTTNGPRLRSVFGGGRTGEIFYPLVTLASYISDGAGVRMADNVINHLTRKAGQRRSLQSETPEEILRTALNNLINQAGESVAEFSSLDILNEVYGLHGEPPTWANERWLGHALRRLAIIRDEQDTRRGTPEELPFWDPRTGLKDFSNMQTKRLTYYTICRDRVQ